MILVNNGTNPFAYNGLVLPKGVRTEIPDDVAKEFLKIEGVEKYIQSADLEKAAKDAEDKQKAEVQALKAKNTELEKKLTNLEKLLADKDKNEEVKQKASKKETK